MVNIGYSYRFINSCYAHVARFPWNQTRKSSYSGIKFHFSTGIPRCARNDTIADLFKLSLTRTLLINNIYEKNRPAVFGFTDICA